MDEDLTALARLDPSGLDLSPKRDLAALRFMLTRRSTPAKTLRAPGPSPEELALILKAASRTPDHGKLTPWRFLLIEGAAQAALADKAVARGAELGKPEAELEKTRLSISDGAVIVAVICSPKPSEKIPEVEQLLSASAVAYGVVNAALAMGYGANWLSGWTSLDEAFRQDALGLSEAERVVGYIHLGTPGSAPPERPRPDIESLITRLG